MSGHVPVTEATARMFVAAWAWADPTPAHPNALGPVTAHNVAMLAELRAGLAALDARPEGAA